MSSNYDKIVGDYKPGSITKIILKNFLTYNNVEITPGPRLNMVVGANGTGKSSILCALCLVLGGEPKLLGRADDARSFIMHEKQKATIKVTLAPHPDGEEHELVRLIDRSKGSEKGNGRGASTFFINKQKVTIKEIQQLVKETYHIAVDNLCTFLPQDKVGSFSGFGQKELLTETEKTLSGSQHLYHQHQNLIDYESQLNSGDHNVETIKAKLEKLMTERQRFEREKERMEERNKAVQEMDILKAAIAWAKYQKKKEEHAEKKEEVKLLDKELNKAQQDLEPLRERAEELQEKKLEVEERWKKLSQQIQRHKGDMGKHQKKHENHEDAMESTIIDLKQVETDRAKKVEAMKKAKSKVDAMKELLENIGSSADELKSELCEAQKEKKSAHRACAQTKKEVSELQQEFREHETNAERVSAKLAKLQDEKSQRRQQVFRHSPDLAKIVKWLDAGNRKHFRHQVWGPVAAEVSMKTANSAAYLENHVPNYVLTSFIVQDKDDYDKLYNVVRKELKVPVNIVLVRNGQLKELRRPVGDEKLATLKREHGVVGYLDESFSAPDAVLQALRDMAAVHKVLVGGDETQKSLDERGLLDFLAAPDTTLGQTGKQGSCIFASKGRSSKKYTQSVSRYSGQISSRIDDISNAKILARGVDTQVKANYEKDLKGFHDKMKEIRPRLEDAEKKRASIEGTGQAASERLQRAKGQLESYTKYKQKLATANSKLQDAEKDLESNDRTKKTEMLKGIMNRISNMISSLEGHASSHDKLMETTFASSGARIDKDSAAKLAKNAADEFLDKNRALESLQDKVEAAQKDFMESKADLKKMKKNTDSDFPLKDEHGQPLPLLEKIQEAFQEYRTEEGVEDMEAALEEAEQKVNGIHDDPNAIKQYEKNLAEIEEVEAQLAQVQGNKDALGRKIEQKLGSWKAALENSIADINRRFVGYMEELGVTGEVRLKKGGESGKDDCDFKNWGIEIRVSFREGVKKQVLSAQVQSGGERSVSTILFLMAMQSRMASPFRCVDEINQGMDERNERAIFRRIVQNSTAPPQEHSTDHCGQYFLITPKLLPSLLDMEQEAVTVLVVMNGPFNFDNPTDFSVDKIVAAKSNTKRRSIEPEDDEENQENVVPSSKRQKKRRSN